MASIPTAYRTEGVAFEMPVFQWTLMAVGNATRSPVRNTLSAGYARP